MVVLWNDIVSDAFASQGYWEIKSADDMIPHPLRGQMFPPRQQHTHTHTPGKTVFLDIGANIGTYTFAFAHAGFKVIAVEAMARNRAAMAGTLCLNPHFRKLVSIMPV